MFRSGSWEALPPLPYPVADACMVSPQDLDDCSDVFSDNHQNNHNDVDDCSDIFPSDNHQNNHIYVDDCSDISSDDHQNNHNDVDEFSNIFFR